MAEKNDFRNKKKPKNKDIEPNVKLTRRLQMMIKMKSKNDQEL